MLKPRLTLCGISWKVMWRRFSRFLKHLECILKLQIGQYFSEGSLEREMVLVWLAEMLIELITQSSSKFNDFMISLFISVSPLWILLVIL